MAIDKLQIVGKLFADFIDDGIGHGAVRTLEIRVFDQSDRSVCRTADVLVWTHRQGQLGREICSVHIYFSGLTRSLCGDARGAGLKPADTLNSTDIIGHSSPSICEHRAFAVPTSGRWVCKRSRAFSLLKSRPNP